ncbi:MAG: phytoene desaturase family protein, partial [Persicimonas sp.]
MGRTSHSSGSANIVIIGAGLGGLICANHLTDRGFADDLVVVEARSAPGGRARTESIGGGALNLGPHALGVGGPLAATLRNWDLWPTGEKVRGGWAVDDGELYRLPAGPLSLLRTRLFPGLARALFLALVAKLRRLDAADFRTQSARSFLDERCGDPRVRRGLTALARLTTYVADLEHLSADVLIERFQHTLDGVLYVDGGWQTMVDGLTDRLAERGVTVRCDTRVETIEKTTESLRVHQVGSEVFPAEAAILAVGPSRAARLLGDELAREAGLDQKSEPVRAAWLDLVLER